MFKGLGDMAGMMAKAKEMQSKMEEMQEQVAQIEASGEAGAGLVTATVTGKGELRALNIDPSIFQPSEKEVVEEEEEFDTAEPVFPVASSNPNVVSDTTRMKKMEEG